MTVLPSDLETADPARSMWSVITVPLRESLRAWLLAIGVTLAGAAAALVLPLAATGVLEALALGEPLGPKVARLGLVIALAAAASGLGTHLLIRAGEGLVFDVRRATMSRLLSTTVPAMQRSAPGDLIARITGDAALLRQIALQAGVQVLLGIVSIVGAIVLMAYLDVVLLLVTVTVLVIPAFAVRVLMPKVRAATIEQRSATGDLADDVERVLSSFTTVKAMGAELSEARRVRDNAVRVRQAGTLAGRWTALSVVASGLAVQLSFLVVLGVGATRVEAGALTIASLVGFLLYAMQLSQPVTQVTQAMAVLQAGKAALERLAAVAELPVEEGVITDPDAPCSVTSRPPRDQPSGACANGSGPHHLAAEFVGVVLGFGDDAPIARLDGEIPPTGVTAIVGPSGAGKSTALSTLVAFHDPRAGKVIVAGSPVDSWNVSDLRRHVALVEQSAPIGGRTLRDALTYGGVDVDEADLLSVVRRLGLADRFVDLDRQIDRGGSDLSGGERRRLALARAIVRRPALLVLDEVTSQLDSASERLVRDLVEEVAEHTAVLIATHDAATLSLATNRLELSSPRRLAAGRHR